MSVVTLSIQDFLKQSANGVVLDVRSPAEFEQGHIPSAVNFPLFTDEERKLVGTIYKQQGKNTAIDKGLELVGPKLAAFVRDARAYKKPLFVHCWRGGMRSGSMAWLLSTAGLQVYVLKGGYKAFRKEVLHTLAYPFVFIVLGGRTGSGKTDVLHMLSQKGAQVIDLEQLANHKGSAFGSILQAPQPTTEHFANLLYHALSKLDHLLPIWIEDESRMIGTVNIDGQFYYTLRHSPLVVMDVSLEQRLHRLVEDYGKADMSELVQAFERIRKKLGGQHLNTAIEALQAGDLKSAATIALRYYDRAYDYGLTTKEAPAIYPFQPKATDASGMADELLQWTNTHFTHGKN
jgi:tRNA 2-selenouridine synthase